MASQPYKRATNELPTRRSLLLALAALGIPASAKVRGIEIGVCGALKDYPAAAALGFDYYEPGVAEIALLSDSAFAEFRQQVHSTHLPCTSCNSFIRTLRVVGPSVDRTALSTYMNTSLDRCRQLGTEIVVWGSAGSRNVPDGFPRDQAWDQIKTFLHEAGDIARARNMVIAIEPLRKSESNIINTGAEALQLVHEVGHPNVKMIIDYYHMRLENESPEILLKAAQEIVHIHFANPIGRRWPKLSDNDPVYTRFFELLRQIHYHGGISVEARGSLATDGPDSLAFFRRELQ